TGVLLRLVVLVRALVLAFERLAHLLLGRLGLRFRRRVSHRPSTCLVGEAVLASLPCRGADGQDLTRAAELSPSARPAADAPPRRRGGRPPHGPRRPPAPRWPAPAPRPAPRAAPPAARAHGAAPRCGRRPGAPAPRSARAPRRR